MHFFSLGDLEEMSALWTALLEPICAGGLCLLGEVHCRGIVSARRSAIFSVARGTPGRGF